MSIFGSILSKIFHSEPPAEPVAQSDQAAAEVTSAPGLARAEASAEPVERGAPAAAAASAEPVDVEAVLTGMAAQKGGGGKWQTSIVDLLKLLDLDSSLAARK